jgi:hypothetical protein
MTAGAKFPFGSVRQAVAALGDNWGLAFDPMPHEERANHVFRAERQDAEVMIRCHCRISDRGTAFDPRVWIGVPLTERPA